MGVSFSYCDASWNYSGFMQFRKALAKAIGLELLEMENFEGAIENLSKPEDFKYRSWKGVKDPLRWFLNHSDCDGYLSPSTCAKVAPRIKEIISKWGKDDYDRQQAQELVKGMLKAVKLKKNFYFK